MDPIKDLKAESELAFDVQQQKQNFLEACRARQTMAHGGGIFFIDSQHIAFLKAMKDLGKSQIHILDHNDNPIQVDVAEFLDRSVERYQDALNTYHQLYQKLKRK